MSIAVLMIATVLAALQSPDPGWTPCSLSPTAAVSAECATVAVPLDHARPNGRSIGIAVKRVRSNGPERRQLWFVDGGPGDAGTHDLARAVTRLEGLTGTTLYGFDHRGAGRSVPLECPAQRAKRSPDGAELTDKEWPACVAHLRATRPDLPFISVPEAARDLDALISRARKPGIAVVVWGVSYGTFLVWEYLRQTNAPPDAIIQDGIVPPDWTFAEFDRDVDLAGRRWLALCSDDDDCQAHLGPDPIAFSQAAARAAGAGRCRAGGLSPYLYRLIQGNLLMSAEPYRRLIPAFAVRVRRCGEADAAEIRTMFRRLFESRKIGENDTTHNPIAQRHLAYSALWPDPPPDVAMLTRALDSVVMTTGVSAAFARSRPRWPVASPATGTGLPTFLGPMLLLHGDDDPTVPMAREAAIRDTYRGPGQTFLAVPWTGHVTLREGGCIRSLYFAFLERPGPVSADCLTAIRRPVVVPDSALTLEAFGTGDVWGDRTGRGR